MSNIITLTDEQMKALQSGQSITIEPPKPITTKWEPKTGIHKAVLEISYGTTKEELKAIIEPLKSYAKQLAWLAENNDGWVADWDDANQNKYYIYYLHDENKFKYNCYKFWNITNAIFMSRKNAEKLCELLNSGIVEF